MSVAPSGNLWGNGDGFLLYPPCPEPSDTPVVAPPVVSIRWELLRDGLEDRELFWLLRREVARLQERLREDEDDDDAAGALAAAEDALEAPGRLARSLTAFTKEPEDLLAERRKVAAAIARCRDVR
jgi:hypothetical protein